MNNFDLESSGLLLSLHSMLTWATVHSALWTLQANFESEKQGTVVLGVPVEDLKTVGRLYVDMYQSRLENKKKNLTHFPTFSTHSQHF